ncbi:MAG: efflux RND transporter periplasmic adaptor subunit [Chloroflexota bacterium]|nr:efflux RND transporter periplasmic adaptor subunit [Chloroflexota bacterium]
MSTPDIEAIYGRSRLRWLLLLALLIAAAVVAFLAYRLLFAGDGAAKVAFSTHRVATTTIRSTITASGVAEAAEETALSFGIPGRVSSIDVKLGDEVKAGQEIAHLESSDLENQLATAEANLASARIRLQQIQKGATDAEKAAAEKTAVSAQVALDTALNDQKELLDGPSDAELAAAEDKVKKAESALLVAQNDLRTLQEGPSDADLAAAESKVATAQSNLASAKSGEQSARAGVQSAEAALQSAAATYCDTDDHLSSVCKNFTIPLSGSRVADLNDSIGPDENPSPALTAAASALVKANSAYLSAIAARDEAEAAVDAAVAALQAAHDSLDALKAKPDPEDVAAAEAAVASAEKALEAAQLALDELRQGPTASAIASAQGAVDSARANLAAAVAARDELLAGPTREDVDLQVQQVRLAELAVERARKSLADAALAAPFDGTVGTVKIGVGDVVAAATPAITLLTPNAVRIKLTLGETDLPTVKVGQTGLIIFDAIQGVPYQITISKLGLAPEISQGVVTYIAEADLTRFDPNADVRPAPGMNGAAVVNTGEKTNVLAVPSRAIRRRGEDQIVEVVVDGKTETRVIQTGTGDATNTEITSGLKAGELVVLPGVPSSQEGAQQEEEIPGGIR